MTKRQKRKSCLIMILALSITMLVPISTQAAKVKFSIQNCMLSQGDQLDINVIGNREETGKYHSFNKKIATISKNGIVRARKTGTTQILWIKGKKRISCNVIVGKAPKVNKTSLVIKEGEQKRVSILKFKNFKLKPITWSSANPEIATVRNGKITGVTEGTTIITVKIKGYTKIYKRNIYVTIIGKQSQEIPETTLPNENNQPPQKQPEIELPKDTTNDSENEIQTPTVSGGSINIGNNPIISGGSITEEKPVITQGAITEGNTNSNPGENNIDENYGNLVTGGSITPGNKEPIKVPEQTETENKNQGNTSNTENEKPVTGGAINIDKVENSDMEQPIKSLPEQVATLVNQEREKQNLPKLILDTKLSACAEIRAEELVEIFSHTRPDDTLCFTILDENNIQYMACAENIAMGQKTAELVMDSWMGSTGHRKNILNSKYKKIGIGYFYLSGMTYWVQLFTD